MAGARAGGKAGGGVAAALRRLEERVAALEARLERMEGGEVRVLKAGLFDGRARARPQQGPKCPGCRLVVDVPSERCPFCGLLFSALPPSQRPVPPPGRKAAPRGKRAPGKAAPARAGSRRRGPGTRAGA
jgi:hypothetical protein